MDGEQPDQESSSLNDPSDAPTEMTAPESATLNTQCASCNQTSTTAPLKPCNKCHSVQYCSRECLKADAKKHKKVCAAAAQIYAQTADIRPQTAPMAPREGRQRGLQKWQFDT